MPDIFISENRNQPAITPADSPPSATTLIKGRKPSHTPLRNALSAFLFMPDDVKFETQVPGEAVVLLLRKHWVTNLYWIFAGIIMLISPIFLFPLLNYLGLFTLPAPSSYISLIILVWYLATFSYILVEFLIWYFTVSIVTDGRIIDIDFINILHKKYSETRIDRVEDVTMRTGGSIRSLFDFGDVIVQTAGEKSQFEFMAVPHPEKVVRTINELMDKFEHRDISIP